jgi:ribosome-binding factor A
MMTRRITRVAEVLRQELGTLIARCKDLEPYIVTVSGIDLTPDLKKAEIFVSLMVPNPLEEEQVVGILNRQRKEWQAALNSRLKLKYIPHLHFSFDRSIQRGDRVMEILSQIAAENPSPDTEEKEP